jgi:hypothetical protein
MLLSGVFGAIVKPSKDISRLMGQLGECNHPKDLYANKLLRFFTEDRHQCVPRIVLHCDEEPLWNRAAKCIKLWMASGHVSLVNKNWTDCPLSSRKRQGFILTVLQADVFGSADQLFGNLNEMGVLASDSGLSETPSSHPVWLQLYYGYSA